MDNNTLTDKVLKLFLHSEEAFQQAREDSIEAMNYVNNNQWSDADRASAEKHKKPALTYNILVPLISTLVGNEQLYRKSARIKANTSKGHDIAEIIQNRWNAIADEQDIEDMLQVAFTDGLISKMGGWIERRFVLNEEGYLDYQYQVANNMRIYLDPETRIHDLQLKSCKWIVKETWETLAAIEERYDVPMEFSKNAPKSWWDQVVETVKQYADRKADSDHYDRQNDTYRVLELQERTVIKEYVCASGDQILRLTKEDYKAAQKKDPNLQVIMMDEVSGIHVTTVAPYFENAILLDKDLNHPSRNFDVFPIFSFRYNIQASEASSFIDLLLDIQDDVNKGKSQIRDYVTKIISQKMFLDRRDQEAIDLLNERGNDPATVAIGLKNAAVKVQTTAPGQIPPEIMMNTESSAQFAQRISLVNDSMVGRSEKSGESGVLFQKKLERAAAAINPYFRNISILRKSLARDFVDNFGYVYAESNRMVSLRNEKGIYSEALVNLEYAGETLYDVRNPSLYVELDEGESNITTQEENFERMLALVNIIANVNPAMVDIRSIVEAAPLPRIDKWLAYIDQVLQGQSADAQEQGQIQKQRQLLENRKIEMGMATDAEKLAIERAKGAKGK